MKHPYLIVFILIFSCKTKTNLPILSYKIDDSGQKKQYAITYSNFKNQLNEDFSTKTINNNVFIANFFFTRCPSICPPMRVQLIDVAKTFKKNKDFIIVSHTIDPKNDSIPILMNYAKATGVPNNKWNFVRATVKETKQQAKQYMTSFKPNEEGTDFYHSTYVALVDKQQKIRGFYNILVPIEVDRLKTDIASLID